MFQHCLPYCVLVLVKGQRQVLRYTVIALCSTSMKRVGFSLPSAAINRKSDLAFNPMYKTLIALYNSTEKSAWEGSLKRLETVVHVICRELLQDVSLSSLAGSDVSLSGNKLRPLLPKKMSDMNLFKGAPNGAAWVTAGIPMGVLGRPENPQPGPVM